jgi:hypothetical protein
MKKCGFTILAAAALALPLCAQVASNAVRVNIPFEFRVRDTTAPAGKYVITFRTESPVVQLSIGGRCYYALTIPDDSYRGSQGRKLVFHRYGNQYFLSQISTASISRDVPMSRLERELNNRTVVSARQSQTEIVVAMDD